MNERGKTYDGEREIEGRRNLKEERREGARARKGLRAIISQKEIGKMQREAYKVREVNRRADYKQTRRVDKGLAKMVAVVPKAQTLRQALVI
jgi:hypothetical protein